MDQKTILAYSCYRGVRGDHCIHKLATEMHLGERKKPSEEKSSLLGERGEELLKTQRLINLECNEIMK